jgi:hypothetical protein
MLLLTGFSYGSENPAATSAAHPRTHVHIGFGVQCLYCHPGAWRQASAGLPTIAKCWGCHQQIPIKNADQQKLADAVASNTPIEWVPVFIMPDFVYFNHRPHIAAGLNCETATASSVA